MPIIKSAQKALRASKTKKVYNDRRSKAMKLAVKDVKKSTGAETKTKLALAYQAIDKAANRGIIKKNAAARKKSRLSKSLKKIA